MTVTMTTTSRRGSAVLEIAGFIRTHLIENEDQSLNEDDELLALGLIDSMGIVRLMVHLQDRYDIAEIRHEDLTLDNFRTIGTIAALVGRYLEESAANADVPHGENALASSPALGSQGGER